MDANSNDNFLWRKRQFILKLMEFKGDQTKAAIAAGYSPSRATVTASELMRDPWVKLQIEMIKNQVHSEMAYNYDLAMSDLENDILEAKAANQHNAVKGLRELQLKISALIKDRLELQTERQVNIRIAMQAGNNRIIAGYIQNAEIAQKWMQALESGSEPEIPVNLSLEEKAAFIARYYEKRVNVDDETESDIYD